MKSIKTRNGYTVNLFENNDELQAHTEADFEADTHDFRSIDCVLSGDRFEIEAMVDRKTDSWKRFLNSVCSAVKATKLNWIDSTIDELFEGMKESIENGVWTFDTADSLFTYRLEVLDDGQWYLYIRQDAFKAEEPEKEDQIATVHMVRHPGNCNMYMVVAEYDGQVQEVFQSLRMDECQRYAEEHYTKVIFDHMFRSDRADAEEAHTDMVMNDQIQTVTNAMNDLLSDDQLIDLAKDRAGSYKTTCQILRSNGINPGCVYLYGAAIQLCKMRKLHRYMNC